MSVKFEGFALLGWLTSRKNPLMWWSHNKALARLVGADRGFVLHFRPDEGMSKPISFISDGAIGVGRNGNEWRWTIGRGLLTIHNREAQIQNEFELNDLRDKLVSTNSVEKLAAPNQYITYSFAKWKRKSAGRG